MIVVKCDVCRKELRGAQVKAGPVFCEIHEPMAQEFIEGLIALKAKLDQQNESRYEAYRNDFLRTHRDLKVVTNVGPHAT